MNTPLNGSMTNIGPLISTPGSVRDGRVRIALLIGGAFQPVARSPLITGSHIALYVDVPAEFTAAQPDPSVICLALAQGQTAGTLVKVGCPLAFQQYLLRHPGVNLEVGLAQLRPIGKLAVKALVAEPAFRRLTRQLLEQMLILTNGSLNEVEITAYTSGAGGTGGPAANVLLAALAEEIERRSEAVVQVLNVRVGPLSYVGCGDRVPDNAGATLAEDLYWILGVPRPEREIRSLYLAELPMVQQDKAARAAFASQFVQALAAKMVREQLNRLAPNLATQTELGTVSLFQVNYWSAITLRRIAEDASADYLAQLEALGRTPARLARLAQLQPVPTFAPSDAKTIGDLVSEVLNSKGVKPEGLVEDCLKAPEQCTGGKVSVTLTQAEGFDLTGDMLALLRGPVYTQAQWQSRLETMRTIVSGLAEAIADREPELVRLDKKFQRAQRDLEKVIDLHFPNSLLKSAKAFWANPAAKRVKLQNAITQARELSRLRLKLASEVELLTRIRARTQDVLSDQERRLENMLTLLRPFQRPASLGVPRATESLPLDQVLPKLLALAEQGQNGPEVLQMLGACGTRVTLAGLASIVGATEAQPASIVQRLLGGEAPVQGPRWGGKAPLNRGLRLVVLPPVADTVLEAIRAHVSPAVDGSVSITAADTAQAGANVVELEVQHPREFTEVVTKFLAAALKTAAAAPELHAEANEPSLDWATGQLATSAAA